MGAIEILIDLDKKTIWPRIVEAFLDNKQHWNESLRECNEEAMDVFKVRDPQTFNRIREEYERKKQSQQQQQNDNNEHQIEINGGGNGMSKKEKWQRIRTMAKNKFCVFLLFVVWVFVCLCVFL